MGSVAFERSDCWAFAQALGPCQSKSSKQMTSRHRSKLNSYRSSRKQKMTMFFFPIKSSVMLLWPTLSFRRMSGNMPPPFNFSPETNVIIESYAFFESNLKSRYNDHQKFVRRCFVPSSKISSSDTSAFRFGFVVRICPGNKCWGASAWKSKDSLDRCHRQIANAPEKFCHSEVYSQVSYN